MGLELILLLPSSGTAPSASNMSASETFLLNTAINLTDIVITDSDSANVTAILTLSNLAAGTLNTGTSNAVTSTFVAGVWTAAGALTDVNTLLAALTFTPATGFKTAFSIGTSVSDGTTTITGSKSMSPSSPPIVTNKDVPETYTEDFSHPLTPIIVDDNEQTSLTVTLTLSDVAAGSLNTGTSGGVTSAFSNGVWSASGAITNLNILLASLVFSPAPNYNSNFDLAVQVTDGTWTVNGTKAFTGIADDPRYDGFVYCGTPEVAGNY
jgi:hypothetical protein